MAEFIQRQIAETISTYREVFPAVALLGPRQCGKSTLIKNLLANWGPSDYLDLQSPTDVGKLLNPELYFAANQDKIICIDEIQLMPNLFPVLRSVIDKDRQNGRFVLLGSASRDLIRQSSESLAGRIGYINLTPFTIAELKTNETFQLDRFWFRGGFPLSYLAPTNQASNIWREQFIQTFLERDLPQLGFDLPAPQMRRFLTMCAHIHGQVLNLSKLAGSLGVTHPTIRRYIDLMEQTFMLRSLPPFEVNIKKRLVKSPKVYLRDSGILHSLLAIEDFSAMLGHPVLGESWEGMVIENILTSLPDWQGYFFRTATGDEVDLVLEKGTKRIIVECKASVAPKLTQGFYRSIEMIAPNHVFVVAPINSEPYPIAANITVSNITDVISLVLEVWFFS